MSRLWGVWLLVALGTTVTSSVAVGQERDVSRLVQQLKSGNEQQQRAAAEALYEMRGAAAEAVPTLIEISRGRSPRMRHAALAILTRIGPGAAPAVPTLIQLLQHDDFHTQYWSCRVLGAIGLPAAEPAVDPLLARLQDDVSSVRRNAAAALGLLGPDIASKASRPLARTLADPQAAVRLEAAIALGRLGPAAAAWADDLHAAFRSSSHELRVHAAVAHWRVTGEAEPAVTLLLGEMQDRQAPMVAALRFGELQSAGASAVPELRRLLAQPETRVFAVLALGGIGPSASAALPELEKQLATQDPDLRKMVQDALANIRQDE